MKPFEVYSLYDVDPVKGRGCEVFTADGTRYLDMYGGHAVISIGHSHPRYIEAISRQAERIGFYSNSVENSLQSRFAEMLGDACGYSEYSLFLCNSGAEANENALKIASFHTGRKKIVAFGNAFHGRTSGAVAATDNPIIRSPFNATDNVEFLPLNDCGALRARMRRGDVAAVIVEGLQGVAGIREVESEFMKLIREECTDSGTVMIVDEIQSGYGRTGKFFAHQHAGVRPDLITCAKGIANGFPMGAVVISPLFEAKKGMLGTTFGGNHLACAAAIAVLEVMASEHLVENAGRVGDYLLEQLRGIPGLTDVRGKGLMIGFDVESPAADFRRELLQQKHIFTGGAGVHTVRLLPALSLSMQQAEEFISSLKDFIG